MFLSSYLQIKRKGESIMSKSKESETVHAETVKLLKGLKKDKRAEVAPETDMGPAMETTFVNTLLKKLSMNDLLSVKFEMVGKGMRDRAKWGTERVLKLPSTGKGKGGKRGKGSKAAHSVVFLTPSQHQYVVTLAVKNVAKTLGLDELDKLVKALTSPKVLNWKTGILNSTHLRSTAERGEKYFDKLKHVAREANVLERLHEMGKLQGINLASLKPHTMGGDPEGSLKALGKIPGLSKTSLFFMELPLIGDLFLNNLPIEFGVGDGEGDDDGMDADDESVMEMLGEEDDDDDFAEEIDIFSSKSRKGKGNSLSA
jgi:hypothetical protein